MSAADDERGGHGGGSGRRDDVASRFEELEARIDGLSRLIERLAQRVHELGDRPPYTQPTQPTQSTLPTQAATEFHRDVERGHSTEPAVAVPSPTRSPTESPASPPLALAPQSPPPAAPPAPSTTVWPPPSLAPPTGLREQSGGDTGFERFVGIKLAAWLGALIVVGAVAVFVRFAYQQGWLGQIPPSVRLIVAYLFCGGLIGTGLVLERRLGRFAAVGVLAAGVGSLFLATLAGHRPLDVLPAGAALLIALVVAAIGAWVTRRSASIAVGIISLLGGFAAPVVLGLVRAEHAPLLLVHLTWMLGVGLVLASLRSVPFGALRVVAVVLHLALAAAWFAVDGHNHPLLAIGMGSIWWAATVGEALRASMRPRTGRFLPKVPEPSRLVSPFVATLSTLQLAVLSLDGTAPWAELASYIPWALALASAVIALQWCGGTAGLRPFAAGIDSFGDIRTDEERSIATGLWSFGVVLWLMAAALAIGGLAIFLDGPGLTLAWIGAAACGIEAARRLRSPWVSYIAVPFLMLSVLGLVASTPTFPGVGVGGRTQPAWAIAWDWSMLQQAAAVAILVALAHRCEAFARRAPSVEDAAQTTESIAVRTLPRWLGVVAIIAVLAATLVWCRSIAVLAGPAAMLAGFVVPIAWLAFAFRSLAWRDDPEPYRPEMRWPGWCAVVGAVCLSVGWAATLALSERLAEAPARAFAVVAIASVLCIFAMRGAARFLGSTRERVLLLAALLIAVGGLIDAVVLAGEATTPLRERVSIGVLWMQLVAVLAAGAALRRSLLEVAAAAIFLAVFASLLWFVFVMFGPRLAGPFGGPLFLHLPNAAGLASLAGVAVTAWLAMRTRTRVAAGDELRPSGLPADAGGALARMIAVALGGIVAIVVLHGSYLLEEIVRWANGDRGVLLAGLSVWWGLCGIGLVAIGFWRGVPLVRYAGLAGLLIVAAKVVVIDLAEAETMWKVVGLLGAGLALVGTSIVYARVDRLLASRA